MKIDPMFYLMILLIYYKYYHYYIYIYIYLTKFVKFDFLKSEKDNNMGVGLIFTHGQMIWGKKTVKYSQNFLK
jgi:hypothetical protein